MAKRKILTSDPEDANILAPNGSQHEIVAVDGTPDSTLRAARDGDFDLALFAGELPPLDALQAACGESHVSRCFISLARLQEQLSQLKGEARAASAAKSDFLANVSHDLRTPLGAVLGFAELLALDKLAPRKRQECAAAILRNGELLIRLIDDILDLSRIEAGRLVVTPRELGVDELLDDLRATYGPRAAAKDLAFSVTARRGLPKRLRTDPARVRQVLNNLLDNALKFTDRGAVTVEAEARGDALVLSVRDTGIGIDPQVVSHIFEPFSHADASIRQRFGGTGLGLAIASKLTRLLGGELTLVSSRLGSGTHFEACFAPLPASDARPAPAKVNNVKPGLPRLDGLDVLVADDARDNRLLFGRMLEAVGAAVRFAEDGDQAYRAATEKSPDLILMDLQMPVLDGAEATARLRSVGFDKPIVAITAFAMEEALDRCRKAGADLCVTKPISHRELIEAVQRFAHPTDDHPVT